MLSLFHLKTGIPQFQNSSHSGQFFWKAAISFDSKISSFASFSSFLTKCQRSYNFELIDAFVWKTLTNGFLKINKRWRCPSGDGGWERDVETQKSTVQIQPALDLALSSKNETVLTLITNSEPNSREQSHISNLSKNKLRRLNNTLLQYFSWEQHKEDLLETTAAIRTTTRTTLFTVQIRNNLILHSGSCPLTNIRTTPAKVGMIWTYGLW